MQIRECFKTTKEEIRAKRFNIIIPVCLGNKFFSDKGVINDNVRKYLEWALENTKDKVLVIVVDKIQDTNYFVRNNHKTEQASLRWVLQEGERIRAGIETMVISTLPQEIQGHIDIIKWEDYEKNDPYYGQVAHTVYKEFKNHKHFRDAVFDVVTTSVIDRKFSEADYWRLCDYVLDEFSIVYSGTRYNGNYYGLYVYPMTDSVVLLIEDIKKGMQFPKLGCKLPKDKIALAILNEE